MAGLIFNRERRIGWRTVSLTIVAVIVAVATQGCCSWARKNCSFPATHSIALAVDLEHDASCACPNADCVCPTPMVVEHANRGDKLQFVNASLYVITVKCPVAEGFVEGDISVDPGGTGMATLSSSLATGTGFELDIEVAPPGRYCPGQPGPRVDIDN
jgi:hypothetical protein